MRIGNKNTPDLVFILENIRDQDASELKAAHGNNWKETTFKNILESDYYIGYSKDDKPVLVFGVAKKSDDIGIIWMLSTQEITEQISFLRQAKKFVENCSNNYQVLCNFVHEENSLAIKWLISLGFKFDYECQGKENFIFFYLERKAEYL